MKRPLAVIGLTYFAASAVALLIGADWFPFLIGSAAVLSVISLCLPFIRKHPAVPAICITSAAAFFGAAVFTSVYVTPTESLYGQSAVVTGTICELPYQQNDRYYYPLETERVEADNAVQHTRILVSSRKRLSADAYDTLKVTVYIYPSANDSYHYYQISRKNYLTGSINEEREIRIYQNEQKPLFSHVLMLRRRMTEIIHEELPREQAGFVSALLLGEKSMLSAEDRQAFRSAGLSHILVVSGYHLAVIVQLMMILLQFLTGGRKHAAAFLCPVFVFLYMGVAGFTPAVVRAGIMQILYLFGAAAIVKTDTLNSLGLAALVICFLNPYTALDVGFLLSFFAVLGITVLSPVLYGKVIGRLFPKKAERPEWVLLAEYPVRAFFSIVTVSFSAMLFTLPVMLLFFKSFALYTILSNLMVSFGVSVLIFCAFLMVLCRMSLIFSFLAAPFAVLSRIMAYYVLNAVRFAADLPFAVIRLSTEFVPVCMLVSALTVICLVSLWKGRKAVLLLVCILMTSGIFLLGGTVESILKKDSIKLEVIDSGQGMTVVMTDDRTSAVLSCGSGRISALTDYLNDSGIDTVDVLLIPDDDKSSVRFAEDLQKIRSVRTVHFFDSDRQKSGIMETVRLPEMTVSVLQVNNRTAIHLVLNGKTVLICQKGTDCQVLPAEWCRSELLICDRALKNAKLLHPEKTIISGTGNFGIRIYRDKLIVRREGYWLS